MRNFEYSYLALNSQMYSFVDPKFIRQPEWVFFNHKLAKSLDIENLFNEEGLKLLSGTLKNHQYYSQGYAGHQFGNFTILGDGRALNIGEIVKENQRYDLQLKGSGVTPYSRRGDGLATLYSMLREYLISEALHHLNIPSTRVLSVIKTNTLVQRENVQQGAIATRFASSHIRVGTFQFAKVAGGDELVKELADYTINRHYNDLSDKEDRYLKFFERVVDRQASLIAHWQSIGFIHGVLNTDNVLISGESIDFGPCAFMDTYDLNTVFSSIDLNGRYKYGSQPMVTSWNLARLAEVLLPLFDNDQNKAVDKANVVLQKFEEIYFKYYYQFMSEKLGLNKANKDLVDGLLTVMEKGNLDYTNTFITITNMNVKSLLNVEGFQSWYISWLDQFAIDQIDLLSAKELMKKKNPVMIPRNHIVEEALKNAGFNQNYELFNQLMKYIQNPFDYEMDFEEKFKSQNPNNDTYKTYCGT